MKCFRFDQAWKYTIDIYNIKLDRKSEDIFKTRYTIRKAET